MQLASLKKKNAASLAGVLAVMLLKAVWTKVKITVSRVFTLQPFQFHKIVSLMLWFPLSHILLGKCQKVQQG